MHSTSSPPPKILSDTTKIILERRVAELRREIATASKHGNHDRSEQLQFRRRGYRENALAAGVLILGGLVTFALARMLGLSAPVASGLDCGALTNTPALAAVQERIEERAAESGLPPQDVKALSDLPVLAYSVAYPLGVVGALICFHLVRRAWRVTLDPPPEAPALSVSDFVVKNPAVIGHTIREVMGWQGDSAFAISRIRTGGCVDIPHWTRCLRKETSSRWSATSGRSGTPWTCSEPPAQPR